MPYRLLCLLPVYFLLLACNDQQRQVETSDTSSADSAAELAAHVTRDVQACYTSTKSVDSIELQLLFNKDSVTGSMIYQIAGKDKNTGKLRGTLRGDSIFAEYSFYSEGTESVREVAFLQKEDSLLEGYGDVEEKAGRMVFKNTSALNFGKGVVLRKVDCKN